MSDNKVAFKSIVHGSTSKCLNEMVNFIKSAQLMADQIVSISMHDSVVENGDLECVIFYRERSTVDNSEPTESLEYDLIVRDEDTDWAKIGAEMIGNVNNASRGKKTL
jgi:hypothetical protein